MKEIKGYMSVGKLDEAKYFKEEFKSEVLDEDIKFPKELGVKHPFEFEDVENTYKHVGLVNGATNKFVDRIIGEFSVNCKNPKALLLINSFNKDAAISVHLREWVLEGVLKGNGFMDLTNLKNNKLRTINANSAYVVRDRKANVKGYNQWLGKNSFKGFALDNRHVTPFLPNEIAHLKINALPGDAYGQGLIMPSEKIIENIVLNEEDKHKLLSRKAGAPIHVKVGQPGEVTDTGAVDAIKNSLTYMTNRTEWVTDANVEMKIIDFGEIGKNLTDALNHDVEMFCYSTQIPAVLLGMANVAEGLAKEQGESLDRTISSIQELIETIIENQIYKPYLEMNGFGNVDVEFVWNLPGEEEINLRLTQMNTMLQNPFLSDGMRRQIQLEIAKLLHFDNAEKLIDTPNTQGQTADKNYNNPNDNPDVPGKTQSEIDKEKEKQREADLEQPEIPGEKNVKQELEVQIEEKHIHEEIDTEDMTIQEYVDLHEIAGFNYSDYLMNVLKGLKSDEFVNLKAITEADVAAGLLTQDQVERLRLILKDGFKSNRTVRYISDEIKNLNLSDRIAENGAVISAETRPMTIARTETVRLANQGLLKTYQTKDIKKVSWLASISDRTCEVCQGNNGRIFEIGEAYDQIPAHVGCRCSFLSIAE